jgi:hypothetical protein
MKNRRDESRTLANVQIRVAFGSNEPVEARLVDHSQTGVRLVLAKPVGIDTPARLIVGPDEYRGLVKYCKRLEGGRGYALGIELG